MEIFLVCIILYLDSIQENTDQKSFVFGQLLRSDNVPSKHVLVLKTSSRRLQDMSWRPYREKQNTYWGCNKSKYISDKSIFLKSVSGNSKANPKCINYNTITSPFLLFWDSRSISIVRIEISDDWFDVAKSAEFKLEIVKKVRQ